MTLSSQTRQKIAREVSQHQIILIFHLLVHTFSLILDYLKRHPLKVNYAFQYEAQSG